MISYQGRKRLLLAACVAMTAAMAAAIFIALQPVTVETQDLTPSRHAASPSAGDAQSRPASDYAVIYHTDLRQPLFDVPVTTAPVARPVLPLRLTGTITEPGFTYAVFRTLTGETKMLSVGDSFEGVEVTAVDANSATVTFNGQTITLKKEATR